MTVPVAATRSRDSVASVLEAQTGAPGDGWDEQLVGLGGHVLQSSAWARCQVRMGSSVFHCRDSEWMWLGVTRTVGPFRRLYLPYGPRAARAAALRPALDTAIACARRAGLDFVQFEPDGLPQLSPAEVGARRTRMRQPTFTWLLRIDADEAALRSGLSKGHRSSINAAERKGIAVTRADSPAVIDEFLTLIRQTHDRTSMPIHPDAYYRAIAAELVPTGEAALYTARHEGRAVAAALVFDLGETRYYAYAASAPEARQLSPAAPLVWRLILDARAAGKRWFDFWGVAPPDQPDHAWSGFTQFKRAFGGQLLERAGTWDLPVRPLKYRAWSLLQSLRR